MTERHDGVRDNLGGGDSTAPAFSPLESLTAVVVLGVLGLILGLVALTMPTRATETKSVDYTHSGEFAYSAKARKASIYGPDGLTSGAPILVDQVRSVTARFTYRLSSSAATEVEGVGSMVARVTLAEGLTRDFVVAETMPAVGLG